MKTKKMFLCTINEEDGELVTLKMAPVDLVALLKLADEIDGVRSDGIPYGSYELYRWQRTIREALGVSDA